ncbi:three-prime repair exonuclease 1-like [Helicoverpa armigera]|uniref:three-prime repair exonuclease 1-like n=1 Tax=Helicoverpa armigera TaxID=29058 RepID=UPI0030829155
MSKIATYVFFDLQTTGLPRTWHGEVRIIELCMLAVKRLQLTDLSHSAEKPPIQFKFKMYFDPQKDLHPMSSVLTKLSKDLLKDEPEFNTDVIDAMNSFLSCLEKPVCLVGHNAFIFHFPLLQYHINKLKVSLLGDIMCSDSIYAFYDILEPETYNWPKEIDGRTADDESETSEDDELLDRDGHLNKMIKHTKYYKVGKKKFKKLRRSKFYGLPRFKPQASYKLKDIYRRIDGGHLKNNESEDQCMMVMKIALARIDEFIDWVHRNHSPFSQVPIIKMFD